MLVAYVRKERGFYEHLVAEAMRPRPALEKLRARKFGVKAFSSRGLSLVNERRERGPVRDSLVREMG